MFTARKASRKGCGSGVRRFILDTDHITLYRENHLTVSKALAAVSDTELAVTIISFEEQVRGWFIQIQQANQRQNPSRLAWAYTRLQQTLRYYAQQHVLPFDEQAVAQFYQLQQRRIRIGTQDLRIAAIALVNGCTVITRNQRDFERVPGLSVADWSVVQP